MRTKYLTMKLILGHFYSYMLASKSSSYVFLFMLLYVLCAQPSHAADLPKVIRKHSNVSAKLGAPVKLRVEAGGALNVIPAPDANGILYVRKGGTGRKDGSSWENGLAELADALLWANNNKQQWTKATPLQIYVAKGTYMPMYSPEDGANYGLDKGRDNAFLMVPNVKLYGGFDPDANIKTLQDNRRRPNKDIASPANATILSGDLGNLNDAYDNAYHLLIAAGDVGDALLDGFVLRDAGGETVSKSIQVNGQAISTIKGAGMHIVHAAPVIAYCSFIHNLIQSTAAAIGGGIYVEKSQPHLTQVHIANNSCIGFGKNSPSAAGVYDIDSYLVMNEAVIKKNKVSNTQDANGGGFISASTELTLNNVEISENQVISTESVANIGGLLVGGNAKLTNVQVLKNKVIAAKNCSAAGISATGNPTLTDVIIADNELTTQSGSAYGAGIYIKGYKTATAHIQIIRGEIRANKAITHVSGSFQDECIGGGVYNSGASARFNGVKIVGNSVTVTGARTQSSGGGIYNLNADPVFTDVLFTDNSANSNSIYNSKGGALFYDKSSPQLLGCTFKNNQATNGGAIVGTYLSKGRIDGCVFENNTALNEGGAIHASHNEAAPNISNSLFVGNKAQYGGAIYTGLTVTTVYIANCSFISNSATKEGGAISNNSNPSSPPMTTFIEVYNSIFWDNGDVEKQIYKDQFTVARYQNNLFQGSQQLYRWDTRWGTDLGANIITENNPFKNTTAGDYSLKEESMAFAAGDKELLWKAFKAFDPTLGSSPSTNLDPLWGKDVAGSARISGCTLDMGANELQRPGCNLEEEQNIIYVHKGLSTGAGTGKSWTNAFKELGDALRWAKSQTSPYWSSNKPLKIYLSKGIYYPTDKLVERDVQGQLTTDRDKTFMLLKDVQIYGGFDPAAGITDLAQRILPTGTLDDALGTILSGDLDGNDIYQLNANKDAVTIQNNANNAYHVLVGIGDLGNVKLDGLTIRGGNANGRYTITPDHIQVPQYMGAGIYLYMGSIDLRNVAIQANTVSWEILKDNKFGHNVSTVAGGGIYADYTALDFKKVNISYNKAIFSVNDVTTRAISASGAGLFAYYSISNFKDVHIAFNEIDLRSIQQFNYIAEGAGLKLMNAASLEMTDSKIEHNRINMRSLGSAAEMRGAGAGIYISGERASGSLTNVLISENKITAFAKVYGNFDYSGAGMYNATQNMDLTNVDLFANKIGIDPTMNRVSIFFARGAGIYNTTSTGLYKQVQMIGNTIEENRGEGGAMANNASFPILINCLLVGNKAGAAGGIYNSKGSYPKIYNTILYGNTVRNKENNITNDNTLPKSTPEFKHSLVGGANVWDTSWGTNAAGNVATLTDPFANSEQADYQLTACSQAANAGLNELFPDLKSNSLDRMGNPRVYEFAQGAKIDMGPLEFQAKAVDMSAVLMLPAEYIYDGKGKTIKATGLPEGITASYVLKDAADNIITEAKNAGEYSLIATLHGCAPDRVLAPVTLTIKQAPLTITARAPSKVYDAYPYQLPVKLYYDGFVNDEDETVLGGTLSYEGSGKDVMDVGSYEVYPVGLTADNYEITVVAAAFDISKAVLGSLDFHGASYVYDGTAKSVLIGRLPELDVLPVYVGNGQTEAGTYTVTASISNARNYNDWSRSTQFEITKAPITGIDFKGANYVYDTKPKSLVYSDALPSGVTVKGYANNLHTDVGEYSVTLQLDGGRNYEDFQTTARLKITKATLTGIDFKDTNYVYDTKPKSLVYSDALPTGVTVKGYLNNEHTDVGDYTVTLQLDGGANYEDFQTTATLKITKATLTGIDFKDASHVYDTKPKTLVYSDALPSGVTVKGYANNLHTNVGDYTVTLQLDGGPNYEDFQTTARLKITKASLTGIDFEDASYVYDSKPKSLVYSSALPTGVTVKGYLNNEHTNVGDYSVTLNLDGGDNYEDLSLKAKLIITKAPITGIDFKGANYVYDTKPKSLVFSDALPSGVTVKGYSNNENTEVGEYTVTLNLDGGDNYEDLSLTATLNITKATMGIFDFQAASYVYDGKPKSLVFNGELPAGATVDSYANNQQTEVGTYTVTAYIKGGRNYKDYQQPAQLTITKAILTGLDLKDESFEYDGKAKSLALIGKLPVGVSIKQYLGNAQTEAGNYTVTVALDGGNNYEPWSTTAVMTITPFKQVISFAKITPVGRDAGVIQLDLKSNSPLPIQLYSDNHLVATVTGDTELTILGVGTSNIRAEQAGNANYSSAEAQEQLLEVLHKQGSKLPVYLHQAVSPNGDGINDFLRIEGIENYPENKLAIYDANGKLLKEIVSYNNTTNNFEGIRIGGVVRNGTYFYVLTVKVAGKWMHDKGFFVIKE